VIQNSPLNISDSLHAEIAIVDGTGSIVHFDATSLSFLLPPLPNKSFEVK